MQRRFLPISRRRKTFRRATSYSPKGYEKKVVAAAKKEVAVVKQVAKKAVSAAKKVAKKAVAVAKKVAKKSSPTVAQLQREYLSGLGPKSKAKHHKQVAVSRLAQEFLRSLSPASRAYHKKQLAARRSAAKKAARKKVSAAKKKVVKKPLTTPQRLAREFIRGLSPASRAIHNKQLAARRKAAAKVRAPKKRVAKTPTAREWAMFGRQAFKGEFTKRGSPRRSPSPSKKRVSLKGLTENQKRLRRNEMAAKRRAAALLRPRGWRFTKAGGDATTSSRVGGGASQQPMYNDLYDDGRYGGYSDGPQDSGNRSHDSWESDMPMQGGGYYDEFEEQHQPSRQPYRQGGAYPDYPPQQYGNAYYDQ